MFKKISIIFSFLVFFGMNPAFSQECKIIVGWEPWDPYQMKDAAGNAVGFDIEFIQAAAKAGGCSLDLQELAWARIIDGLKSGEVGLTAGASKTAEREEFALFSDPYRQEKMVMFVRKGDVSKFPLKSLEDIVKDKMTVGVITDYEYGPLYATLIKKPEFTAYIDSAANSSFNLKKMLSGRIDGFLDDELVGISLARQNGSLDKIEIHPVPVSANDIYFMVSKKSVSPENLAKINEGIRIFKASPEYQTLLNKYTK